MNFKDRFDRDEIIHRLGLDRQVNTMDVILPSLAIFGAGVLVGAGLGLLLAPKSGRELRSDITEGVNTLSDRTQHLVQDATRRARARLTHGEEGEEMPSTAEQADNPYAEA